MKDVIQVLFVNNTLFAVISILVFVFFLFLTVYFWNKKEEESDDAPAVIYTLIFMFAPLLITVVTVNYDMEGIQKEIPITEEYQKTTYDTINFIEISSNTKEFWNIRGSMNGGGEGGALFLFGFGGGYGNGKIEGSINGNNNYTDYYCFYAIDRDSTIKKYEIKSRDCTLKSRKDAHYMIVKSTKIVSVYPTGKDCLYRDSKGNIKRKKQFKNHTSVFTKRTIYIDEKYVSLL